MKIIKTKFFNNFPFEATAWLGGLFFLAVVQIDTSNHFTFCPFAIIGIEFCPGCGLGRSINHFFNLNFLASFNAHPLGIPALFILLYRSTFLIKNSVKSIKHLGEKNNGKSFTFNA